MPVVEDGSVLNLIEINKAFASAYETLAREDPMKCDKSNVVYDPAPVPDCVILDVSIGCCTSLLRIRE